MIPAAIDRLQSRFARGIEAEYGRRAAAYQEAGLTPEDAHLRAIEDAKQFGLEALEELRRRGLFPFSWAEPEGKATDVG